MPVYGIPGNKNENTDFLALKFTDNKMEMKVTEKVIGRSHRIGQTKIISKHRPVIVQNIRCNNMKNVFSNMKKITQVCQ